MVNKPSKCKGCLLEHHGTTYVPDELIEGSQVMIIGQNPDKIGINTGRPFDHVTGQMLENDFLPMRFSANTFSARRRDASTFVK